MTSALEVSAGMTALTMGVGERIHGIPARQSSPQSSIATAATEGAGASLSNNRSAPLWPRVRSAIVALAGKLRLDPQLIDRHLPSRSRWMRRPGGLPPETCLFVTLAKNGCVPEHALYHARAWRAASFGLILIIVADDDRDVDLTGLEFADGILLRENRGYDFGAWADAIKRLRPKLGALDLLVIANDSVFGPLANFENMIAAVRRRDADIVGLTDSYERIHHIQSFVLFFKRRALQSAAFRRFWSRVRQGDREWAVECYELNIGNTLMAAGLSAAVLHTANAADSRNLTLLRWQSLIENDFPYVKAMLLRDNPYDVDLRGWQDVVDRWGYDPEMIGRFFNARGLQIKLGSQS